jgi:hypothetical protein
VEAQSQSQSQPNHSTQLKASYPHSETIRKQEPFLASLLCLSSLSSGDIIFFHSPLEISKDGRIEVI